MAGRKEYRQIGIDVEPFLSIMAIVLKLISLILVVIVMRIAINQKMRKIIDVGLWSGSKGNTEDAKEPHYIDCFPDKILIYPNKDKAGVTWEDLQRPDNAVVRLLDSVQAHTKDQYIVIMARPNSVKFFRQVRKMVSERPIDYGYDVVDADFKVDWDAATQGLSISTDDETNAPAATPAEQPPAPAHTGTN